MKKVFFIILFGLFGISSLMGQCNSDKLINTCVTKLANEFNFLKSYKIDGETTAKKKIEYSYVFTKGTQYMLNLCTNGDSTDEIVITLFDSSRNKVASNKINGQYVSMLSYACNATGIYYIQYTFDGSSKKCGGSSLGFKR